MASSFPSDAIPLEAARLTMEHGLFKHAFRRSYFAPVEEPHDVLDIVGGVGLWCLEFLRDHPDAHVIGLGIDKGTFRRFLEQPRSSKYYSVLDRLTIMQTDVIEPLPFQDGAFDFTLARAPAPLLSHESWRTGLSRRRD